MHSAGCGCIAGLTTAKGMLWMISNMDTSVCLQRQQQLALNYVKTSDVRYCFLCILHIAIIAGKIITITIIITIINM